MRRLAVIICTLLALSACGGKKVRVAIPGAPSSSELEGIASYYAEPYHGRRTANGEIFDTYRNLTAAHRTLPFNTLVRVMNRANGKEVDVRINDRGPFIEGRVIDLSLAAARQIDMVRAGIVPVKLVILKAGVAARGTAIPPLYSVQVAAFENRRAAEDLKLQLEKKYPAVIVQTVALAGDKTVYRVRIGRDPDIQTAHKLAEQLRKEDFESIVVRVN